MGRTSTHYYLRWPLILKCCVIRIALAFNFNLVFVTLCVGLSCSFVRGAFCVCFYYLYGACYVMRWLLLLIWCILFYTMAYTFNVVCYIMRNPLLLIWYTFRYALALTFNVMYAMLCFGLYF